MNCDQAFDALTDTNMRDSNALCVHLDGCPRCRDMAELLDPALDLFGEVVDTAGEAHVGSVTGPVHNDGPADQSRSSGHETPLAKLPTPGIRYRPWLKSSQRRAASQQDGLKVAAFLMLIAVLMAAMVNVERGSRNHAVTISLPEDCQRTEVTEATSDNVIAGCVACHLKAESLAELQPLRRTQAAQLVQRCVSCHLEMTTNQHLAELVSNSRTTLESDSSVQLASCLFGRRDG